MISVEEARTRLLGLVTRLPAETVPLLEAAGRTLATAVRAARAQPPFDASAMDGYAVAEACPGEPLTVIGVAAAGARFAGRVATGEAVRIFTGAPVPEGATRVVIQEDVTRAGDIITPGDGLDTATHIRSQGSDFTSDFTLAPGLVLGPSEIALLAAMNAPAIPVTRKPTVALIATGDELVQPGEVPGPDQIIASNSYGLHALLAAAGAAPRLLPAARDRPESLAAAFDLAQGADLVVTIGGASVGDHDVVARAGADLGLERDFYKIAMRPGKPLMAGRLGPAAMVGLPGNPVSAMVCGSIFLRPMLSRMLGQSPEIPAPRTARLAMALGRGNGPRAHYMRARVEDGAITVFSRQDSALLSVLSSANALAIRPPGDPPRNRGAEITYLPL